jgi:hypothetical protein
MKQLTESEKQKYQRMLELCAIARQRYLDAGGDPQTSSGSLNDNSYMTTEERHEFLELGRQLAATASPSQETDSGRC